MKIIKIEIIIINNNRSFLSLELNMSNLNILQYKYKLLAIFFENHEYWKEGNCCFKAYIFKIIRKSNKFFTYCIAEKNFLILGNQTVYGDVPKKQHMLSKPLISSICGLYKWITRSMPFVIFMYFEILNCTNCLDLPSFDR